MWKKCSHMINAIIVVNVAFSYTGGSHNPHNFINEFSHLAHFWYYYLKLLIALEHHSCRETKVWLRMLKYASKKPNKHGAKWEKSSF
jgi:hypothetical protein